ncbi:MAG: response regulator [Planctomycetota bacterium]
MTVPHGLLLTRDLMFTSKITSTAASLGLRIDTVSTVDQLQLRVAEAPPRVVFLDLNCPDFDPSRVVAALPSESRPRVIAFGSHVDEARLNEARAAGCDDVLPRSKFSATLPELLRQIFEQVE